MEGGVNKLIVNGIAIVIASAWAISFVLDAIVYTYEPPQSVHALMLIVSGAAFTSTVMKNKNGQTRGDADERN